MTNTSNFPEIFGIVRHQAYGGPRVQYLKAEFHRGLGPRNWYFTIRPLEDNHELLSTHNIHYQSNPEQYDVNIYKLKYMHPEIQQVQEVNYWYLPMESDSSEERVPFLDFQYRSWIPIGVSHELPDEYDILERIQYIQQRRLAEIQREENPSSSWNWSHFRSSDNRDDRHIIPVDQLVGAGVRRRPSRPQTPPPTPPTRIVERIVERVVTTFRASPLPKAVGDVLLANARRGTEACPISTTPFSECGRISITSCFHTFDFESLARWRESHNNCPVCRSRIENVVSEDR